MGMLINLYVWFSFKFYLIVVLSPQQVNVIEAPFVFPSLKISSLLIDQQNTLWRASKYRLFELSR